MNKNFLIRKKKSNKAISTKSNACCSFLSKITEEDTILLKEQIGTVLYSDVGNKTSAIIAQLEIKRNRLIWISLDHKSKISQSSMCRSCFCCYEILVPILNKIKEEKTAKSKKIEASKLIIEKEKEKEKKRKIEDISKKMIY